MNTGDEEGKAPYTPRLQPYPPARSATEYATCSTPGKPANYGARTGKQTTLFDIYKTKISTNEPDNDTLETVITEWIVLPLAVLFTSPLIWGGMQIAFWLDNLSWKITAGIVGVGSWLLWGGLIFAIASTFHNKARQVTNLKAMQLQEQMCSDILDKIKRTRRPDPYFVFLRPFAAENAGCAWYTSSSLFSADTINVTTIDDELIQVLQFVGPTLCLGNQSDEFKIGAKRIPSTDETWREDIHLLLEHCTGVFLFPWYSESTMEEVVKIFERPKLIGKTVFFMPPARSMRWAEEHWKRTLEKLAEKNILLPKYLPCGVIFNKYGEAFGLVDNLLNRRDFQCKLLSLWRT